MRAILPVLLAAALLAGCTDHIPQKLDFGSSGLKPVGDIPPEFAEANNYDPAINRLVADQICAQPAVRRAEQNLPAVPGEFVEGHWRCWPYVTMFDAVTGIPAP